VEIGGRQGVAHRVGYLHVSTVGVAGQRDLCHIPGGRVVVVIVQAVGAGKVGVGTAQLAGPGVHPGGKGGQVSPGGVAGQHAGRVVGAGHQHGVEHVEAADALPGLQANGVAPVGPDGLELRCQAVRDGDALVQVGPAFQYQQGGHHLGQAGNGPHLIRVLLYKGLPRAGVKQIDRLRVIGRLDGHSVGGGKAGQGQRRGQGKGEHQRRRPAKKGMLVHGKKLLRKFSASS